MELKEIVGKQIAENCDSIASSRMIFELLDSFDKYENEEDSLKNFLRHRIKVHKEDGEFGYATELDFILKRIEEIDAMQDAIEIQIKHLVRNIKTENWLSNGLWRGVRKDEKEKEHLEKVG